MTNKIFVEDFYDWHPAILMASKSFFTDVAKSERAIIRLYSEIDYKTEEVTYRVSVSSNNNVDYREFPYLFNAVHYYNEQLKGV